MARFAQVIIDIAHTEVDRVFTYLVPNQIEIGVGQRVMVPFGRGNALKEGYVVSLSDTAGVDEEKLKPISHKAEGFAALLPDQIELAAWMAKTYRCLLVDALRLMIPSQMRGQRVRPKTLGVAHVALSGEELKQALSALDGVGGRKAPAQAQTVRLLMQVGAMAVSDLYAFLPQSRGAMAPLREKGIVKVVDTPVRRVPYKELSNDETPRHALSDRQREALGVIAKAPPGAMVLLHGATGSGKTEVYLGAIERVLDQGKSAILLVPEIALTPQTVARFRSRLGDLVAVMHSRLSAGERYDEWRRVRNGEATVVIGPRSALFAPAQNLGLIVIDEEHEPSYYSEQRPQYHAHDVAQCRARHAGAVVVLGSATPQVETFYRCAAGEIALVSMPERFGLHGLPKVTLVDMRHELMQGNRTVFSAALYRGIEQALEAREQVMLFINRRGFASFMMCRGCGYVYECPSCDISLTYHKAQGRAWLQCHYCGHTEAATETCPKCAKPYLKHFGTGTQQVEEQVNLHFPNARVLRMDHDTTRGKDAHMKILQAFGGQEADILIGTQMIAKGLDFENVTLVGVMAADASLYLPDYRSAERTFSLIMQVAGRAGRDKPRSPRITTPITVRRFNTGKWRSIRRLRCSCNGFSPPTTQNFAPRRSRRASGPSAGRLNALGRRR
jgi:primosomal protein N' (replication factor Y)